MNNPVGFDQDAEAPPGTGVFRFEDGSSLYAMEPDLAKRVTSLHGPKLAQNGTGQRTSEDPAQAALLQRLQAAGPPATASDFSYSQAPAAAGVSEVFDDSALPAHLRMRGPAPAAPPPEAVPAPPAPGQIGPPLPPGAQLPGPPPPPRPRVSFAGRDPMAEAASVVPVPTKASTVIERQGAPYDPGMAGLREQANQAVVGAKLAEFEAQRAQHEQQATALQASLPSLQQQAAEQKSAFEKLKSAAQKERGRIDKYVEEYDRTAQVDPGRIYKAGFGLAGISMMLGQALGAYAATLAGGDNFAQKIVQQKLETDLAAQRENIKEGRVGIDNMLARLQREYGDAEQAESAWKILQSEVLDREIKSYQAAAQSGIVDRAAAVWLAQNQSDRLREEQKFMELSIGKSTQTVSADMVVPRRGGSRPMTDAELEEAQIKANERGVKLHKSENELGFERKGGKYAAESAPDPKLYVEGFGNAKTEKEAVALRTAKAEYDARERMLDRMAQLNDKASTAIGIGDFSTDEKVEADALSRRFATSIARGYGGPITDSDRKAAELITPDPTSVLSGAQDVKIKAAREESRNTLNAQLREIVSGNHPELPESRKERE